MFYIYYYYFFKTKVVHSIVWQRQPVDYMTQAQMDLLHRRHLDMDQIEKAVQTNILIIVLVFRIM